jgi:cytochrome c oxidase subunit I
LLGGVTGVMVATVPADLQYHDSYFVVAHFHYVIIGGVVFAILAALHYWWPRMFGTQLDDKLGKWTFWLFFIGFHLTFFIQHFLGLIGMPRRYWTYQEGQNFELGNMISTIGAFFMGVASLILVFNIIKTLVKNEKVSGDPWDGRTLEWSLPNPSPSYNFKQLPLVRGLDALWIEKTQGNGKIIPAEPVNDIHMPNSSFLPFMMALGLFIAGLGFIYRVDYDFGYIAIFAGLILLFGSMLVRSVKDDLGHHIHKEDLDKEGAGIE